MPGRNPAQNIVAFVGVQDAARCQDERVTREKARRISTKRSLPRAGENDAGNLQEPCGRRERKLHGASVAPL
jgi:hypothetical protein